MDEIWAGVVTGDLEKRGLRTIGSNTPLCCGCTPDKRGSEKCCKGAKDSESPRMTAQKILERKRQVTTKQNICLLNCLQQIKKSRQKAKHSWWLMEHITSIECGASDQTSRRKHLRSANIEVHDIDCCTEAEDVKAAIEKEVGANAGVRFSLVIVLPHVLWTPIVSGLAECTAECDSMWQLFAVSVNLESSP
ncbi:hypothetical protein J6590_057004 [Homalodisca vitripennis]|nr:hypothetical protein J6590_057004 [Homalodisca vitripennis]